MTIQNNKMTLDEVHKLLSLVFKEVKHSEIPEALKNNTIAIFDLGKPNCNSKFIDSCVCYIRNNALGIVTDFELIYRSSKYEDHMSIQLIYPHEFSTTSDLVNKFEKRSSSANKELRHAYKEELARRSQLSLFPIVF